MVAPTELLAQQHYKTLSEVVERMPLSLRPQLRLLKSTRNKVGMPACLPACLPACPPTCLPACLPTLPCLRCLDKCAGQSRAHGCKWLVACGILSCCAHQGWLVHIRAG